MFTNVDDAIDDTVAQVLSKAPSAILIYLTTPPSPEGLNVQEDRHTYEMDDDLYPSSSLHTDLKRDLELHSRQSNDEDAQAGLPLFERYMFLSPRKRITYFLNMP